MINESILCLALAIHKESRGAPLVAQQAVAEVIHNRTKHKDFPNTYCGVIKQKNQFSFYKGSHSLTPPKTELASWNKSLEVAKNFYKNKTNHTKGALYFNTTRLGVRYKITTTNGKPLYSGGHVYY